MIGQLVDLEKIEFWEPAEDSSNPPKIAYINVSSIASIEPLTTGEYYINMVNSRYYKVKKLPLGIRVIAVLQDV